MSKVTVGRAELGRRLHILRWPRFTLLEVEQGTGIPQSNISRWERAGGKAYPPADALAKLAAFYGVSVDDLLDPDWDALGDRDNPGYADADVQGMTERRAAQPSALLSAGHAA